MNDLVLFDSNCMLGLHREDQGVSFEDIDQLLEHMERFSIQKSLLFHAHAKYYDHIMGNEMLLSDISGHENLYPAIIAIPNTAGEFMTPQELAKYISKHRISAVRLCPTLHGYELSDWMLEPILNVLNLMKVPLFLDFDFAHWSDPVKWPCIYDICNKYTQLPVVLVRTGCAANRNMFALMDKCSNFYIESSYYAVNRGFELMSERYSSKRMLFGTAAPIYAPACPIGMLHYSDLDFEQKQMVGSNNLEQLLGEIIYDI